MFHVLSSDFTASYCQSLWVFYSMKIALQNSKMSILHNYLSVASFKRHIVLCSYFCDRLTSSFSGETAESVMTGHGLFAVGVGVGVSEAGRSQVLEFDAVS